MNTSILLVLGLFGQTQPNMPPPPEICDDVWRRDEALTTAVNEFAEMVPYVGAQKIKLSDLPAAMNLLDDLAAAKRLVTRKEQRMVVQQAFRISRTTLETKSAAAGTGENAERFIVALRGSPGIGKSWSILLYIKLLLLDKRRPIIVESGDSKLRRTRLFQYDEGGQKWIGYTLVLQDLPPEWLNFKDVDAVVDPAQFSSAESPSPARLLSSRGHIFIAVSPDDRHLGGSRKTASGLKELVLGPWTYPEIRSAWPFMFYNEKPREADFEARKEVVERRYYEFGGLPRYLLNDDAAEERAIAMTPACAKRAADTLLEALSSGKIDDRKKILTLFFTLYPGVNETGQYDPMLKYATVEFVSQGALRAAGQTVFKKIESDVVWRNASDASSVGLAFEAAALMFLHMGTEGMNKMGIQSHCRELQKEKKSRSHPVKLELGFCSHKQSGNFRPMVEAANESEFFENVKRAGDTLEIQLSPEFLEVSSSSEVSFPPPGIAVVDGMSGPRLGFQATLQASHSPSGVWYLKQRRELGVAADAGSVIFFIVPHGRFTEGWTSYQKFKWRESSDEGDEDAPSNKRRRGAMGESKVAATDESQLEVASKTSSASSKDRSEAGKTLRQFVLSFTLSETNS